MLCRFDLAPPGGLTGALPGLPQGVVERRRELDTTIAADRALTDRIADLQGAHLPPARRAPDGRPPGQHLGQARRMLEKYRVQLGAQQLGTAQTVSDARIGKMLSP